MTAAQEGDPEVVSLLLERGADSHLKDNNGLEATPESLNRNRMQKEFLFRMTVDMPLANS